LEREKERISPENETLIHKRKKRDDQRISVWVKLSESKITL